MRLLLAWIGKTKHPSTAAIVDLYLGRLRGFARAAAMPATVAVEEFAGRDPEEALLRRVRGGGAGRPARLWLFDPAGRSFDSPAFARFLAREAATYPQGMVLAIGGADGFSPAARGAAAGRISLSPLTFSHELARLVALEQIYRALAILNHHPFPH